MSTFIVSSSSSSSSSLFGCRDTLLSSHGNSISCAHQALKRRRVCDVSRRAFRKRQEIVHATATSEERESSTRRVTITETAPPTWFKLPWTRETDTTSLTYDTTTGELISTTTTESSKNNGTNGTTMTTMNDNQSSLSSLTHILARVSSPLLPTGWPETVGENYGRWAFWHVCRHITRNAYYVIGTTSLLISLGVDKTNALAVSASLKWVLKDGLAMGTKLILSTSLARIVDESPKRFRFLGDCIMSLSVFVEILSLQNPKFFLIYGSLSALLKDAGKAMSGPAYRVFLDAFATSKNIGDVSSKGEAQVVIGNLIGLGLGVGITKILNELNFQTSDQRLLPTLIIWAFLSIGHLSSTFKAVSMVTLNTLNEQRLDNILCHFEQHGTVPSVKQVNEQEQFVGTWKSSMQSQKVIIGASIKQFSDYTNKENESMALVENERFFVSYRKNDGMIGVMLHEDAQIVDALQGILQARRYIRVTDKHQVNNDDENQVIMKECAEWAKKEHAILINLLEEEGWSTDKLLVGVTGFRYRRES